MADYKPVYQGRTVDEAGYGLRVALDECLHKTGQDGYPQTVPPRIEFR